MSERIDPNSNSKGWLDIWHPPLSEKISPNNGESQGFSKEETQRLGEITILRTLNAYKELAVEQGYISRALNASFHGSEDIRNELKKNTIEALAASAAIDLGGGLLECTDNIQTAYSETTFTRFVDGKESQYTDSREQWMRRIASLEDLPIDVIENLSSEGLSVLFNTREKLHTFLTIVPEKDGTKGSRASMLEHSKQELGQTLLQLVDEAKKA